MTPRNATILLLVVAVVAGAFVWLSRSGEQRGAKVVESAAEDPEVSPAMPLPDTATGVEAAVRKACTRCHGLPPAESMPAERWRAELQKMWQIAADQGQPITQLDFGDAVRWFEAGGKRFSEGAGQRQSMTLRAEPIATATLVDPPRSVAMISSLLRSKHDAGPGVTSLLATDMGSGLVLRVEVGAKSMRVQRLAQLKAVARAREVDFDGDGRLDILAAGLGLTSPSDLPLGSVALRRTSAASPTCRRTTSMGTATSTSRWPSSVGASSAASS